MHMGSATSTMTFFRSMGGAFGVAVFGTILSSRLDYYVLRNVPAGALRALGSPSGSDLGRSTTRVASSIFADEGELARRGRRQMPELAQEIVIGVLDAGFAE